MLKIVCIAFIILVNVILVKSQTCFGSSNSLNIPTKCFEIESILVDACDGGNEGQNEMVRLRIGVNSINISSFGVAPYNNTPPNQTVNWGAGSSNLFRGFCDITTVPANQAKINIINANILAAGNCGKLIPINSNGIVPAGSKLLIITSTSFNATAQDFSGLTDTLYVIMQCSGNTSGHFANQANSGTRKLIIYSGTCADTVTYTPASLIKQNQTIGAEDGGTVNFTYTGVPTYVNYGCAVPITPFSVNAGAVNPSYCNGSTVNLAGLVSGTNCYVWQNADTITGVFADTTNLLTNFTIRSGYIGPIKLYLKARSNCSLKKDSVMFNAIASLGILNAGVDTSLCNASIFQVNAATTATGTISWTTTGAGALSANNILNPFYTPSLLDTGLVNLIITQTTSCGSLKDTLKINYSSKQNPHFTLSDSMFCYNNMPMNINLNPFVSGGVFSSNIGNFAGNVYTFNSVGSFYIKYKIGTGACADSLTKSIYAYSHFNSGFSLSDTLICKNAPKVILSPLQSGGIFSGEKIVGNYFNTDSVGVFNVKYKISNAACNDSTIKIIEVKAFFDPDFTASKTLFCLNEPSIILTPKISGGVFTGENVMGNVFTPSSVGVFSVKYKIANNLCVDSSSINVKVLNKPNASFVISDTIVCQGSSDVFLTPTQTGGVFSGTHVSAQLFSPGTTGVFPIKYLISNGTCTDSSIKVIEVKAKPDATFQASKTWFCLNDASITLIPKTNGGIFTGPNVLGNVFTPNSVGIYPIKYKLSNGFCFDSSSINFTVNSKPNAAFVISDTIVCQGSSDVLLTPTQAGGIFSGTHVSAQLFSPITTGVFPIKYLISNGTCSDSSIKTIEVVPKANAAFSATDSIFCLNDPSAVFTPFQSGGVFSGNNLSGNLFAPSSVGNFTIVYKVGTGQCADSSFKIMVVNNKPKADFSVTNSNGVVGDTIQFTYNGIGATSYWWQFGNNTFSGLKNPFVLYTDPKVYNVWLKVTNNEGCEDSIQKTINIEEKEKIFVPNVFTPQGDGVNDVFNIVSYGIEKINMKIYNRWGGLIFETNNLLQGWDGNYENNPCSIGVYFYLIEAVSINKKVSVLHGTVTLLR